MPDLAGIPAGTVLMVDANILVYYFEGLGSLGAACRAFLRRAELGELTAVATTHVVADVVHRLMCLEAARVHGLPVQGILKQLQKHPDLVRALPDHGLAPERLRDLGLTVVPVTWDDLVTSRAIRQDHGLLTGDSVIVAVMRNLGITNLTTNNGDFDAVDGLVCWRPPAP